METLRSSHQGGGRSMRQWTASSIGVRSRRHVSDGLPIAMDIVLARCLVLIQPDVRHQFIIVSGGEPAYFIAWRQPARPQDTGVPATAARILALVHEAVITLQERQLG